MTPKEKAKELVDKFIDGGLLDKYMGITSAKECALIAVYEITEVLKDTWSRIPNIGYFEDYVPYNYWKKVKKEIQLL